MLRYVYSSMDGVKTLQKLSINILMVIEWGRQTWNDVTPHKTKNCFEEKGLNAQEEITEDNSFEGEELLDLQALLNCIDAQCSAKE